MAVGRRPALSERTRKSRPAAGGEYCGVCDDALEEKCTEVRRGLKKRTAIEIRFITSTVGRLWVGERVFLAELLLAGNFHNRHARRAGYVNRTIGVNTKTMRAIGSRGITAPQQPVPGPACASGRRAKRSPPP